MKKLKIFPISLLFLGLFSSAIAQNSPTTERKIARQFEEILMEMKKINLSNPESIKQAVSVPSGEKIFDKTLSTLNADLENSRVEILNRKSQYAGIKNGKSQPIDKNLLPLMEGMPEPIIPLPDAKKAMNIRDEEIIFTIYIEKLKRIQEQLMEEAGKYLLGSQDASEIKMVSEKKADQAMQDLKNNSLVQEAGGLEKLQQMSPEERAAWGKKMAEKVKNNPSAFTGNGGDPRKAFSNKMMNDPGYAARFQHMNQQQQQEEYRNFMSENGFVDNEAGKSEQIAAGRRNAMISIEITNRTMEILNHRKQLSEIAGAAQKKADDYFQWVNDQLNREYARQVEALPVVEHGEAGKGKDTHPVDVTYQFLVYSVETQQAVSNKEVWKRYQEAMKVTIAEYNEFLSEYWGRDKQTDRLMAERNQTPPAILAGACEDLIRLTQMAKYMTNQNAGWQRSYDEKILHLYESIGN